MYPLVITALLIDEICLLKSYSVEDLCIINTRSFISCIRLWIKPTDSMVERVHDLESSRSNLAVGVVCACQRWASPSPDLDLSPTYAENLRTWT